MEHHETPLPGVRILKPRRHTDARGYFSETWNRETLRSIGIDVDFVQDNHSLSHDAGVLRGLHFQAPPRAQDKLVRVTSGAIMDVIVDIRRGSATFGTWASVELSAQNGLQVFIPKGFLHGFVTRLPGTEIAYKCSDVYAPECEGAVHFADPDLAIDWGIAAQDAILSEKDRNAPKFRDFQSPFVQEDQS